MFAMQNLTAGQLNAIVKKLGGEEGAKRLLRGELVISESVAKKLFERLSTTIALPAVVNFTASEHFIIDTSKNAKVKISYLSDNFKANFLPKVEKDEIVAEKLVINKLLEDSFNSAIITALGGEVKIGITLGQFFAAFAKQPNGKKGVLLKNGHAYVGYIRDTYGELWAVGGVWSGIGWDFGAVSIGSPNSWGGGLHFLSR